MQELIPNNSNKSGQCLYEKMAADGSLRRFSRVPEKGMIIMQPAPGPMGIPEQISYARISSHLMAKGVPVPKLISFDPDSGTVWVEDLGTRSLFNEANTYKSSGQSLFPLYEKATTSLVSFQVDGRDGFDPKWCYDTPFYTGHFAAKREALYFTRFFLERFMGLNRNSSLEQELISFSQSIDSFKYLDFLIHRDFQSRNLFLKEEKIFIIDFQGAMIGPIFYDLAALLNDPYVNLPRQLRGQLFNLYLDKLKKRGIGINQNQAQYEFRIMSLFRLLQVLGAFSFLYLERKRSFFKDYIPTALATLKDLLVHEEFFDLVILKTTLRGL